MAYNDWTLETLVDDIAECYATCVVAPQWGEAAPERIVVIPDGAQKHLGSIQLTTDPGAGLTSINPLAFHAHMPTLESSVDIEAPPDAVWEIISDLDRYPDWISFVDTILFIDEGQTGEGTVYREYGGIGPLKTETEWRITAWNQPRWLIHQGDFGVIRPTLTFDLVPTDEGTRLEQTVEFAFLPQFPRFGWWLEVIFVRQIFHLLLGQVMKPSLRRTIQNAKRLCESEFEGDPVSG